MTQDDETLEAFLAAARREEAAPPPALIAAVLADAAAVTAARARQRPERAASGWRGRAPALSRWRGWVPATTALAASALLGFWIGVASEGAQVSLLAETAAVDAEDPVGGFFDLASAEN
jgi:hypothetical protein